LSKFIVSLLEVCRVDFWLLVRFDAPKKRGIGLVFW